jgi:pantetheine-phosphate adenylyltransferase
MCRAMISFRLPRYRKLEPTVETVYMMPAAQFSFLSSRVVREVAFLGGSLRDLVPPIVEERLRAKVC